MKRLFNLAAAALFAVITSGCAMSSPPADLDVRLTKPSTDGRYLVTMRQLEQAPAINRIHAWEVTVVTSAGQPVSDARIGVSGGMPQHHHGFPTNPQVTESLGDGRYLLDGVKFSMTGWWQFKLQVNSASGNDLVVFNTVVNAPGATTALASSK
jgi:hypothetical protein